MGGATSAEPAAMLDASAEAERQEESPHAEAVDYVVYLPSGEQVCLALSRSATVVGAYERLAAQRALPVHRLKMLTSESGTPLRAGSEEMLASATLGEKALLLVVMHGVSLGRERLFGSGQGEVTDATFDHYPVAAYQCGSEIAELETVAGKTVTRTSCCGIGWVGVLFSDGPPLWGRVLIRAVIQDMSSRIGIGIGTGAAKLGGDPEDDPAFYGLYQGWRSPDDDWDDDVDMKICAGSHRIRFNDAVCVGDRFAMLVDVEAGTMQCYCGLKPLGDPFVVPKEDFWPIIIIASAAASIAVDTV